MYGRYVSLNFANFIWLQGKFSKKLNVFIPGSYTKAGMSYNHKFVSMHLPGLIDPTSFIKG